VISFVQYSFAYYAVPVTFSGRETLIKSGKDALIDLVEAHVKVAESTMMNLPNCHFYLDGTGNSGKNITGLAAALPLANTAGTYGAISRAPLRSGRIRYFKLQLTVAALRRLALL
jgi:hypothetical protein